MELAPYLWELAPYLWKERTNGMKKGRELENLFERWIKQLNDLGCLAVRIEVKTNFKKQVFLAKQPFDYLIIAPGQTWGIDSKECSSNKFYPSKAPAHQIEAFKKMQNLGHRAGFVIWFKRDDPIGVNLRFIETFDKPCTINDGTRFDWLNLVNKKGKLCC